MNELSKFEKIIAISQTILNFLLVFVGILGLIFVAKELNQITEQNKSLRDQSIVLDRTLKQSYRPIGIARCSWDNEKLIKIGYPDPDPQNPDKFSFSLNLIFKNKGKGLLRYLGSVSYLFKEGVPFRKNFLEGTISDVYFDGMYSYLRGKSLLPGETTERVHNFDKVEFLNKYFIYIPKYLKWKK